MHGMGGDLPPVTPGSLLTHWQFSPLWSLVVLLALVGYLLGGSWLRSRGEQVSGARTTAFVVGLVLLVVATMSGIGVYAMTTFWVHMVQHLTLIMLVPALFVLGGPLALADRLAHGRVERALRTPPLALLTHPIVGFVLYTAVIVGTHLTGFMDQMMSTASLEQVEQVLYVLGGYLFLLPLLGEEPIRWRLPQLLRVFLLVVGMVPDTVVGIVLLQTDTNLFPAMLSPQNAWAPDPVQDLHVGGGLMWAAGDGLMMVFAVGLVVALLSSPSRRKDMVGSWLEGVRRSTMQTHVTQDGAGSTFAQDADVDEDDDVLAAYNAMLKRMGSGGSAR